MMLWWLVGLFVLLPSFAEAACSGSSPTLTAASAAYTDVNDCITAATDGDTVNVPSGTQSWASTLTITNKSISLIGAGIGNTVITCTQSGSCLTWTTKATGNSPAGFTRLSGFTFKQSGSGGCAVLANGVTGSLNIAGVSANIRIDNNRFEDTVCGTMHAYGYTRGVMDHNQFVNVSCSLCHSPNFEHESWNNAGGYGDQSWASDSTMGTADQWVLEDNTVTNSLGTNGWFATNDTVGARVTYRFNTWTDTTYQTHGTESNGRPRGQRHTEFYRNRMSWALTDGWDGIIAHRGGTGYDFDNAVTDVPGSRVDAVVNFNTYRSSDNFFNSYTWSLCGQFSITSISRSGTTATATHTGRSNVVSSSGASYITISGANESGFNGTVKALKATDTTFTYRVLDSGPTSATGTITAVSPFDGNTDSNGYPCMDQLGRGKGILISGTEPNGLDADYSAPNPNPPQWAGNALEPLYVFHNLLNGTLSAGIEAPAAAVMTANRDYYNEDAAFTGASGVGRGTSLPATCTTGVGYWKTDEGDWNTSTTETHSADVGYSAGADGVFYKCTATNTWTLFYEPYTYPHPLISGESPPADPPSRRFAPSINLRRAANDLAMVGE